MKVWSADGENATKGDYHIIAGRINDIAWDGDSQRIIAVGDGKERFGHCITADSGNTVGEISGQSSQINCVSIRQQRPIRAATGSDDTSLAFFHGPPFKFNALIRGKHNKFVYGTAFSPDGSTLVSVGSDRKIWLYDGKTGEPQKEIGQGEHTGSIFAASWAKDSKRFATASGDQTVKVWDAEAGQLLHSWQLGNSGSIGDQQVGVVWPHGRSDDVIISLSLGGDLNYLLPGKDKPSKVINGHQKNITAVTMHSGKSPTLWTGSSDGSARAWNVAEGQALAVQGDSHTNFVSGIAAAADGDKVYSIGWDDTVRTIDTASFSYTTDAISTTSQPSNIAISDNGTTLAATSTAIQILNASGNQPTSHTLTHGDTTITALAASPTTATIAVGFSDKTLAIYTLAGTSLNLVKADIPAISPPSALAFSPTGAHLAVGKQSGSIAVLKTADWSIETERWSAHSARIASIAWSPDGRFAVSGSLDTNVFVWSMEKPGKRVKAGNAHKDGVNGVVWLEGGSEGKVASVGADAAVKVWKVSGLV